MTVLALTTVARIYNIVEGGRCSGFEPVGPQEHPLNTYPQQRPGGTTSNSGITSVRVELASGRESVPRARGFGKFAKPRLQHLPGQTCSR